ncbi:PRC and DUF2382 domain-containing protein [Kitasatospora sp. NPDC050543]|uniref:PRC and DUF2382 domain-containing protein n=1 Tax=Kitasatospora sp. NPDC050543 TaxID=3364054 RepID=UPI0037B4C244
MQTDIDPRDLIGHKAVDRNGDKIGTVDEVYLDDATGEPEWAAVRTGIFGRDAFVPLTTSEFLGEELRVPYDKSLVKESPDFGVGQHLSPAQELQLYRYYGLDTPTEGRQAAQDSTSGSRPADLDFGAPPQPPAAAPPAPPAAPPAAAAAAAAAAATTQVSTPAPTPMTKTPEPPKTMEAAPPAATTQMPAPPAQPPAQAIGLTSQSQSAGLDRKPPAVEETNVRAVAGTAPSSTARPPATPGAAMEAGTAQGPAGTGPGGLLEITCHEERIDITTEWQVMYTARLRRYVTSETVERHVPVVRERVRVERVPVSEGERDALTQQEIAEAVEEVTLREERPVVRKYLVPVERVRLVVERYTDDHVVREELHREHVEIHDSSDAGATPGATTAGTSGPGMSSTDAPGTTAQPPNATGTSGTTGTNAGGTNTTGTNTGGSGMAMSAPTADLLKPLPLRPLA